MTIKNRAIFFDRDGVINDVIDRGEDCFVKGKKVRFTAPWLYDEFHLKDGVHEALKKMKDLGFLLILATNQPDIKYGRMTKQEHERIMSDIRKLPFDAVYVCEHRRDDGCGCKKPKPGMFLQAIKKQNIDCKESYAIGDRSPDLEPAKELGCKTILIESEQGKGVDADYKVLNLQEAVEIIKKII
ncbi:HAD-IIIA family hydrolase [Patescibacteria group bacterium]|nr:HAD-IIIA family hydrolase [Patescibacteria group bacterium]